MKKTLMALLATLVLMSTVVACNDNKKATPTPASSPAATQAASPAA